MSFYRGIGYCLSVIQKACRLPRMTPVILTRLFVEIDDYMKEFALEMKQQLIGHGVMTRNRDTRMSMSEIMTIIVYFQMSGYRNFKDYYIRHVSKHFRDAFPELLSYKHYVALKSRALLPLAAYMKSRRTGEGTGISFVDSTSIVVCHSRRSIRMY